MEDVPTLLKTPKSECPDTWIRLPRHKWPKSRCSMADQSFLSKGICTVILWQDYYGKRNLRNVLLEHGWESFRLGIFICQPSKRTILTSVCGRYQTGKQDRKHRTDLKILMKDVDLGGPTRECQIRNDIVTN